MKIYLGLTKIKGPTILVLGMFDGIHIGHRRLINEAVKLSENELSPVILCTFNKRPVEVLKPDIQPDRLTTTAQRAREVASLGVNAMCIMKFDKEMANQEPEYFIENLVKTLNAEHIFVGYNYTFGKGGRGNGELLKQLGVKYGFKTHVKSRVSDHGETVSSTRIRSLIKNGNVARANELLQYTYAMPVKFLKKQANEFHFEYLARKIIPKYGAYKCILTVNNINGINDYEVINLVQNKKCIALFAQDELLPCITEDSKIALHYIDKLNIKR
ncbi:MAG: hypothetical protein GYA87_06345 [Christensenellaceae bacterium]|nr:hypothetical protein [Christensenellaceae bacterium]